MKAPPAWLEVDLNAIRRNVRQVRDLVGDRTGVIAVVKADAYGHGMESIGTAAVKAGAAGLAVALVEEGARLRAAGLRCPILVMGSVPAGQAADAVRLRLTCALCEPGTAAALSRAAVSQDQQALVEMKVDTGMGRLGVRPEEAPGFLNETRALPGLRVRGIFSHLSSAEDPDPSYTQAQLERLLHLRSTLGASAAPEWRWHLANSAGTVRFPECRLDAVRVGLLVYGINPATEWTPFDLSPAVTWKSRVTFLKRCEPGTAISYGRTYLTGRTMEVATLGLGYADGYPRSLSNSGEVLLGGARAPILGRICMDQMMVAVPESVSVRVGDEAVLLGRQGNDVISVEELAARAGTIPHEILARLGSRLARVYTDGM